MLSLHNANNANEMLMTLIVLATFAFISVLALSYMFDSMAILLRKRVFREHDFLLTIYTQQFGKLTVLGRGMQKIASKLAAHAADFFVVSDLRWVRGAHFDTLTSAQASQQFGGITTDLVRIGAGCRVLEAMDRWTREDVPEPVLWTALIDALALIEDSPDPVAVERAFCIRMLSELGWSLKLNHCLQCNQPLNNGMRLAVEAGGGWCQVCCGAATGIDSSNDDLIVLRLLQSDRWKSVSPTRVNALQPVIEACIALHRQYPWSTDRWRDWTDRLSYRAPITQLYAHS